MTKVTDLIERLNEFSALDRIIRIINPFRLNAENIERASTTLQETNGGGDVG